MRGDDEEACDDNKQEEDGRQDDADADAARDPSARCSLVGCLARGRGGTAAQETRPTVRIKAIRI